MGLLVYVDDIILAGNDAPHVICSRNTLISVSVLGSRTIKIFPWN